MRDVDAIAVTSGPGLAGALLVGVAAAKAYALAFDKPLYGVNHLSAHVAVDVLEHGPLPEPCVALLVSGGHSSLLLVPDLTREVQSLGLDGRRRGGRGVRQGRPRARAAVPGRPAHRPGGAWPATLTSVAFPRGKSDDGSLDFSFSGLKTAVARWVEARERAGEPVPVAHVAASFQEAVVDVLTMKAIAACRGARRRLPRDWWWRRRQLEAARRRVGPAARRRVSRCGYQGRDCALITVRWWLHWVPD